MSIQTSITIEEITTLSNALVNLVQKSYKGFNNTYDYFQVLRKLNFSKIELLIIDSALKGMPVERLDKTLMLKSYQYIVILNLLLNSLKKALQNKTLKPLDKKETFITPLKSKKLNLAQRLARFFQKFV